MKNSSVHSTLSEVYRLLSDHTAADFARASEYRGITPFLKEALRALALEAQRLPDRASHQHLQAPRFQSNSAARGRSLNDKEKLRSDIIAMIRYSPRFSSTQSILKFATEAGLDVSAKPKESRERLAGRVADAILLTSEPRRTQMVTLFVGGSESQTQGWIDVIKGARR